MKILDVSPISAGVAMPIKSGTLQFLQDAYKDALKAIVTTVIPNAVDGVIYILSGCVNSTVAPIHTILAGWLYYNGEIYQFDGATFTLTGLEKAYARIETTQFVTNADPVQFSDAISRNVHNIRKIVIENTVVDSGLPEFYEFYKYGVLESDNETDELLTSRGSFDIDYTVTFQRQGNITNMQVTVKNTSASTYTGSTVFVQNTQRYEVKTLAEGNPLSSNIVLAGISRPSNTIIGASLSGIFSIGDLGAGETVSFSLSYPNN